MAHCQKIKFDKTLKLDYSNTRLEITVPTGVWQKQTKIFLRER